MAKVKNNEVEIAKKVLVAFADKGVAKTSMADIASASGISRQSIYKRFGSKEACYAWVIEHYLADMYARIFALLEDEERSSLTILQAVFSIFVKEAFAVTRQPFGAEVFNDVLSATHASKEDWPIRFRSRLASYIESKTSITKDHAYGIAFALISAGKGLMLEARTNEEFDADMTLIIGSLIQEA